MLLNWGPQKVKPGSYTFQECGCGALGVYLRLTGFDSLHLGTITCELQTRPGGRLLCLLALAPSSSPPLWAPTELGRWWGSARPPPLPALGCTWEFWRRRAFWGVSSLNVCNSRTSRLRTESISPTLGDPGGMSWGEGNSGCQLITQPAARGLRWGQEVAMCLCHL